jgi:RNA polymerase sigma-70 factor (ECF subfamily)
LLDRSSRVDPELCYLQDMYGDSFRDAFAEAVASLSDREQTLLRMSYVQQLRVRAIGRMYGVHHATAARWVEAAREALVAATRICLRRRLVVSDAQLDSIIALIRSRIEEDVAWVLQASPSFAG